MMGKRLADYFPPPEFRYMVSKKFEQNSLDKEVPVWYIRDTTKTKHGKLVAKFWDERLVFLVAEMLNDKYPIRRRKRL